MQSFPEFETNLNVTLIFQQKNNFISEGFHVMMKDVNRKK